MTHIAIIDYGMGNLHSVAKALEKVSLRSGITTKISVTGDSEIILNADRLLLPGVGAMRDCMAEIRRQQIDSLIREQVMEKPVLGICVGMQAMMEHSDENGGVDCIGLCAGNVLRFAEHLTNNDGLPLKVPHMGWNNVAQTHAHPMWHKIKDESYFYFVHSYCVVPDDAFYVVGNTTYTRTFCSALADQNLFAVQFHPEKSQDAGLQLLENFLTWDGNS
jgi:glutamine amidotransferase